MAPTRLASKSVSVNENVNGIFTNGITTRSKQLATLKTYKDNLKVPNKRKADSPLRDITAKRAAFGDITNAFNKSHLNHDKEKAIAVKKVTVESKILPSVKNVKTILNGKTSRTKQLQKVATNALETVQKHFTKEPPKPFTTKAQHGILKNINHKDNGKEVPRRISSGKSIHSDISEASLYTTALENITPVDTAKEVCNAIDKLDKVNLDDSNRSSVPEDKEPTHQVPPGVVDFDKENWNDIFQVSHYAMDIFNYLKSREPLFPIDDYLERMKGITSWMRALLVDWMVEVQESFELNHETLYLAVKLVDLYLTISSKTKDEQHQLSKDHLQLLGAASLYIAAKYDERIPPLVDDFLYICDGAYSLRQLLRMEADVLRVVGYDLGAPLSYRFLRRFARSAHVSMLTLTLARFILELCLLEYGLVSRSDSQMAAAALYVALRMKGVSGWTPTLRYYTGYSLRQILPLALEQNAVLHKKPRSAISTVRNKYSHTVFFEVAKVPLLDDKQLSANC